jgi:hypothetical protein
MITQSRSLPLHSARPFGPARIGSLSILAALTALLSATPAAADRVTWTVDSTNSYLRLAVPDQAVPVPDVGTVTVRFRDASSSTSWTDGGGRRAALAGEILTDYQDGVAISFRGGEHNVYAIESTALRPNPASWNATTTNYTDTTTAPAALGARIRGSMSIFTFDIAYLALRSLRFDLTNNLSGPIPLTNGAFASQTTQCGLQHMSADVDGLELPLGLGSPIPDIRNGEMAPGVLTNAAGGSIANLSALARKLTYTINLTNLTFDVEGTLVTGSATGQIVATATLAPPPPPGLSVTLRSDAAVLAWSTNAAGFTLQSSPALPASTWLPVTPPPVVLGSEFVVTNSVSEPAAFYRLHKP